MKMRSAESQATTGSDNILILLTHTHRGKNTNEINFISELFLLDSNEIKQGANEVSCSLDFSPEKIDLSDLASVSSRFQIQKN